MSLVFHSSFIPEVSQCISIVLLVQWQELLNHIIWCIKEVILRKYRRPIFTLTWLQLLPQLPVTFGNTVPLQDLKIICTKILPIRFTGHFSKLIHMHQIKRSFRSCGDGVQS
ncbi:Uncharacterised protein [Acinetobacter baumannii]|nr:Uncharacterised protein [Acinetobacter baumannii]